MPFSSSIILFLKSQNQSNLWKINTLFKIWDLGRSWIDTVAYKNSCWHRKILSCPQFLTLYLLFLTVTELKYSYNYLCNPKDTFHCINRVLWFHLWKSDCFWYCASIYIYLHWLLFVIGVSGIWLHETSSVLTAGFCFYQITLFDCRHWKLTILSIFLSGTFVKFSLVQTKISLRFRL